jgi:hypothetical protein
MGKDMSSWNKPWRRWSDCGADKVCVYFPLSQTKAEKLNQYPKKKFKK